MTQSHLHRTDLLQQSLGYEFHDLKLLSTALTHSSYSSDNNKRLSYLGDAVLRLTLSELLYMKHQHTDQKVLTQSRTHYENNVHLAAVARKLGIDAAMSVSRGARKDGGGFSELALAGTLEAVLGAIYLDSDLETARAIVDEHIVIEPDLEQGLHPKTLLQEHLDRAYGIRPKYVLENSSDSQNQSQWRVRCVIQSLDQETIGLGASRKLAETQAAETMLKRLRL